MYQTVIYTSASTAGYAAGDDLQKILATSRRNNARARVSGVLLFAEGSYIQVLEGPPDSVEKTYDRIKRDSRHHHMIELYRGSIARRNFPEWSMGYPAASPSARSDGLFALTRETFDRIGKNAATGFEALTLLKSFYTVAYGQTALWP